ncbi:MAG: hypothetical protein ACREEM_24705 [Blastocatellia bacterium]
MKIRHLLLLLFIVGVSCYSVSRFNSPGLVAAQITFVQAPAGNQDQNSNRQTLPPDKKRSLPGLGPDELFTEDQGQKRSANQSGRPSNRRRSPAAPSPAPSPTSTPASTAAAKPAGAMPSPSPAAEKQPAKQAPAKAPVAAALSSSLPPPSSTNWQLPALGVLTLLVSAALFYVLVKLRELLREGGD